MARHIETAQQPLSASEGHYGGKRVTPNDLADMRAFVARHTWTFAKTMPQIPHWYVVRNRCRDPYFSTFVTIARTCGYEKSFGKSTYVYIDLDDHTYWTMGWV